MLKPPLQKPALNAPATNKKTKSKKVKGKENKSEQLKHSSVVSEKPVATSETGELSVNKPIFKRLQLKNTLQKPKQLFQKSIKRLSRVPKRKAAAALGILGAGTGFAFTQVAPADVQSTVLPEQLVVEAPLRRSSDPAAESFVINTRGLFLTHQIFYRKVEVLARIPGGILSTSGTASDSASANSASTAADRAKQSQSSSQSSGQPTVTPTAAAVPSSAQQAEKVVAAAPPAPEVTAPAFTGETIDSVLEMRVSLARDVDAIAFAASDGGTITDLDGNVLRSLPAETASYAEVGNGIVVDGETLPSAFWVYPENGGYVAIGDSWYRGRMLIALRKDGLIAVNYVLLGDYLYSVVGSEMSPGWAMESLKAQAVAARSYALTHNIHPASETYFDLDNTQRFQAYKGIGREASTTQAAVQATAGEFISHDGGIVESLYAASQAIVDDAHKGSGMSQLGAKDLAEQGYDYTAILAHYYPGTALGRLEIDPE